MEANKNIPKSFYCELTNQLMQDPVLDRDGHTYERASITEHLSKTGLSPITFQPMSPSDLIPNVALRKTIEEFFSKPAENEPKNPAFLNDQDQQKLEKLSPNDLNLQLASQENHVLLSLVPPMKMDGVSRTPSTVVCVIDVSGSMGEEAKIKTEVDSKETYGFTTLDLVKHAMRTIIKSLTKDDKLSLVSFSNSATVVLDLTSMDAEGQKNAMKAVDSLYPDASTNLWDGLYRGMEVLRMRNFKDLQKNAAVLLLTDGMPNVEPPRGHIPQLLKYKEDIGGELPGIVNTFGFGYSLDSKLLSEIAEIGKGTYAFIPDGSFVGTIFVNSLSSLLSTVALNVEIGVDTSNLKIEDAEFLKNFDKSTTNNKLVMKLGSVLFNQRKDVVLPVSFANAENQELRVSLKYSSPFLENFSSNFSCKLSNTNDNEATIAYFRIKAANLLLNAVEALRPSQESVNLKAQTEKLNELLKEISTSPVKNSQYITDLLVDLKEQVSIALSTKEFYTKWGKHYLPSLARAHLLQQCNNFKDPGVQHFGGEVFRSLRDKLDNIFMTIPPPEPTIKRQQNVKVSNMQVFYNSCGVCFGANSKVFMADGSKKLVKNVRKGDIICAGDAETAEVLCVVETKIKEKRVEMVVFENGLEITPWHPVRIGNVFRFPADLRDVHVVEAESVYNFVVSKHHIMRINGVDCVTLGHCFKENAVVAHEYFGSEKVVEDLKKIRGWQQGLVELQGGWIRREQEGFGRIVAIQSNE